MTHDKHTSRCTGSGPLEQAVRLNEEIKQVIDFAARVNMTALNANLMARRAGDGSRGFRVVASELGGFSRQLENHMGELAAMIFRQVRSIADMLRHQRHTGLFRQARDLGQGSHLDAARDALESQFGQTCRRVTEGWRQLAASVTRSQRLCRTGESLVWSARMEAARGGDMEPLLRQVAEHIAQAVTEIGASLRRQGSQLAGLRP